MAGPSRRAEVLEGTKGGGGTRARIIDAAIRTLKGRGFAGASARAIAQTGGFNQALIFYHFGTVNDLLLAALDETSARRMQRYSAALRGIRTLPELMEQAARIYREDLESGHIKDLAFAVVALYLGVELLAHLNGQLARAERLIDTGSRLSSLFAGILPTSPGG